MSRTGAARRGCRLQAWGIKGVLTVLGVALLILVVGPFAMAQGDPPPPGQTTIQGTWPSAYGVGDTGYISAICTYQGDHTNWRWTADTAGMTPGFQNNLLILSGTTTPKGTYTISTDCEGVGHGDDSKDLYVVEVESLEPNMGIEIDDENPNTRTFLVPQSSDTAPVVVTATPSPDPPGDLLPASWQLTGGSGGTGLYREVSRAVPTIAVITCKSGTSCLTTIIRVVGIQVVEPSDEQFDPNRKLWRFGNVWAEGYPWCNKLAGKYFPAEGTFSWEVTEGKNRIDFFPGDTDSITVVNNNEAWIMSTSASVAKDDVTVRLTYNDVVVCTKKLTVFGPKCGVPTPGKTSPSDLVAASPYSGYDTTYHWQVLDILDDPMPADFLVNEAFGVFIADTSPMNWNAPEESNGMTNVDGDGVGTFRDHYGCATLIGEGDENPVPIGWDVPGAGTPVQHSSQWWYAGIDLRAYGKMIIFQYAHYYRGYGRAQ